MIFHWCWLFLCNFVIIVFRDSLDLLEVVERLETKDNL